eukprot:664492-Pelagomonas_calceolata.AAC.4
MPTWLQQEGNTRGPYPKSSRQGWVSGPAPHAGTPQEHAREGASACLWCVIRRECARQTETCFVFKPFKGPGFGQVCALLQAPQVQHHHFKRLVTMHVSCRAFVFFGNGNWHAGIKGNHVKGRQSGINCVRFSDGSTIVYELPGLTVKGAEHEVVLVLRMSDDRILDAGCQGKLHGARQRLGQPVVVMCFLKYTFVPYPSSTCGCLMGAAMHQVRGRDEVCGPEEQAHVSQSVHNVTEVKFVVQKSVLIKFILSITLLTLPTQISLEEFVNMSHEVREMAEIREC